MREKFSTKSAWNKYGKNDLIELEDLCTSYKKFLSDCKTERECVAYFIDVANKNNFKDLKQIIKNGEKLKKGDKVDANIDVYIMSVSEEEKIYAIKIAQDLRLNNVISEINGANLSLKSQFKIADNLNAKYLIILNNEDLSKGLVTVKDNVTKEEEKVDEKVIVDYILGVI